MLATNGMVVAQERRSAEIGRDILARGGNAVDAAVATGFAMAVTYPRAGNIGGGGFMVIHSAERNEAITIDYRETAPAAATRDMFLGADGKPDPAKSRSSVLGTGVPGTVAGLALGAREIRLRQVFARRADRARHQACARRFSGRGRHGGFAAERTRKCSRAGRRPQRSS